MDNRLHNLFSKLKLKYKPAELYDLRVSFYPYKNINHTIRLRNGVINVRISDKLKDAPDDILEAIGSILFDKLFRIRPDRIVQKTYRSYINSKIIPALSSRTRKPVTHYNPEGKFYNLSNIFDLINKQYFEDRIHKPVLGWSKYNSIRRLAFYDHERNLIVVSRIFDKRNVPAYVVAFLMYHEMLHIVIPVRTVNGRRVIHPPEFKIQERKFRYYADAQKWITKKRRWVWF